MLCNSSEMAAQGEFFRRMNLKIRNFRFSWAVIAVITVILALLIIQLMLRMMFRNFAGAQCAAYSVPTEILSPDRLHKIDLVDDHCVGDTGQSVLIILLGAEQVFSEHTQSGLPVTNLPHVSPKQVSVLWVNPQKVLISYPKSNDPKYASPHLMELNLSGIDVQIQSVP
jgi:hypothetical protein